MTKWILIASVAALAITAPAQAERGDKHGDQTDEQAQAAQARAAARGGGRQQQQAPQQQARQPAQQARQFQQQAPQQQARPQFQQRAARPEQQMQVYQQRARPERQVQVQQRERPQQQMPVYQQRARPERQMQVVQQRVQRARPERQVQVVQQRVQRARPERQVQVAQPRAQRVRPVESRAAGRQLVQQRARVDNRVRLQDRVVQRQARTMAPVRQAQQQRQQQARAIQPRVQRVQPSIQSAQRAQVGDRFVQQQQKQEQRQADRFAGMQQRFDQRSARIDARATQRAQFDSARLQRPQVAIGQRLTTPALTTQALTTQAVNQNWYGDYAAQRYSSFYTSAPNSYYNYNYNDGYLYQVNRNSNLVTALFPLLGGAFGAGQMLPYGYQDYNVPYGYQSLYYDTPDYSYRYGDGAIYRIDPNTQLIESVVALLSGQNFGIGQQLPMGYDVYNVPYGYRDQYYDTADNWYRYDNGMIYQVDPYSRMIESSYPMSYGGYQVGYPVPSYGGYAGYPSYSVPYAYQDLYYGAPGYNYQYSNGGIYQVDPSTQLVSALVGLVSGQNLGIGQQLPMGYDAYNVPYAYRDQYYDTADSMYRYDDGYIYGVDPQSRMIQSAYPVSYDGYAVGYPMAANAGYAVPSAYDGLYTNTSGYDYRYANGGIYQIDPNTRMVQSIAALMTGQNFGVGQMLPNGYDAYNVPYAYRSQYYDTPNSMYRYADGNIYQVDPQTRVIQSVIDAVA